MTTDTPTETTDQQTMLATYDETLTELLTFNFAKLDDFNAKMAAVEELCEDPIGRAAIEDVVEQVRGNAFADGKDGERAMIVVDQRFTDAMLDLRAVLDA